MSLTAANVSVKAPPDKPLRIQTLGGFRLWRDDVEINETDWGREKAIHLFQFFVTARQQNTLHKEEIINRLWPELDVDEGNRDFKVALHTINKVLEPERKPRAEPRFVLRHSLTYGLNLEDIWIDADAFETAIAAGNQVITDDPAQTISHLQQAMSLYHGDYLPERRYEDWCSFERERLQVLALNIMTTLADLLLESSPLESIRLTQHVLTIDPIWENAYRTQIKAYLAQGNRPMALRVYQQCVDTLQEELAITPLPETEALYQELIHQS